MTNSDQGIKDFESRQKLFGFLGLLILLGISIIANNLHLQAVAQQSTKYISRMIQLGDFREVHFILEETLTENFKSISYKADSSDSSFSMPASVKTNDNSFWHAFSTERVTVNVTNPLMPKHHDSITYEYGRFGLIPFAVAIWGLLILISIPQTRLVKRRLLAQFEKDLIIETSKVHEAISDEVRHNLRTPLAALLRIPARMPETLRQDRELLTTSINQIRKITAALDRKHLNQSQDPQNSELIYDTLIRAINQIESTLPPNIIFASHIDDSIISAKVPHIPVEMQVLLGNIVNNALDAIHTSSGEITIRASDSAPDLFIEIINNGPGIPSENLSRIFDKGFTSGKLNGTGHGLYHAKNWITNWGGRIKASSLPQNRTSIKITIPIRDRFSWYVPRLKFDKRSRIFILDDQLSARQLWQFKLSEYDLSEPIIFLSSISEAEKAILKQVA